MLINFNKGMLMRINYTLAQIGMIVGGGITLLLTGCSSSEMASYDTPGSPKSRYFQTGEVNRINPDSDSRYVRDSHHRLYTESYLGRDQRMFVEDSRGNSAPMGFMYDDHDRLVPVDRYLTESDRQLNHRIRDSFRSRNFSNERNNISLTTINGDVVVRGWVRDTTARHRIENQIRDIVGSDNVRFEVAS
jgi:hypothetical protein